MPNIPIDAYLMIIGAMKSGTSTLYWYLKQHPSICRCIVKEPEFFTEETHRVNVAQYSDLWNFDPERHKYVLEASTGYTKYPIIPNVPEKIKAYGISPTFVYVVRDPFKRIESDYNASIYNRWFNPKTPITDNRYVFFSNYFVQLEQYRKHFGSKNIVVLDFDELVTCPNDLLAFLFDRLKLNCSGLEVVNEVRNKTRQLSQAEVFFRMHPLLNTAWKLLPVRVRLLLKRLYKRPFSTLSEKVKLTEYERLIVHNKLKHDMSLFNYHYSFPVKKWGF